MTSPKSAAFRRRFVRTVRAGFILIMVAGGLVPSSTIGAGVPNEQSVHDVAAAQPGTATAPVRATSIAGDALVLNRHLPTLGSLAARAHLQVAAAAETVAADPICDIFANGYDETGATPCAGCFDATIDFDETDIDCGGVYCKACAEAKKCAVGSDCSSGVCNASLVCAPATCANGIKDGTETGVDCGGGTCLACPNDQGCNADSDCLSNACDLISNTCVANACLDQRKDGSETGVDCGGGTCPACANTQSCSVDADCLSNACDAASNTCVASQCIDHHKDGAETGVDCGGGVCPTCASGQSCGVDADCTSTACDFITGVCASSKCVDQRKDGAETDIDCGGNTCPTCANAKACLADSDCTSNACDGVSLTCVANQCSDHRQDGLETAIDCGGGICSACGLGLSCNADADCASNACDGISNTCVASQCSDHRKDGVETDVDCGGADSCSRCSVGQKCLVNGDCAVGHTCNPGGHTCL